MDVDSKVVERLVHRIGQERIAARDAAVAADQELPLMQRDGVADPERPCPAVAMVSIDGGRLQVRDPPMEPDQRTPWRESKTAVLETSLNPTNQADPDPDVPRCFFDLKPTVTRVRGLGQAAPKDLEFEVDTTDPAVKQAASNRSTRKPRPSRPQRLVRVPSWSTDCRRIGRSAADMSRRSRRSSTSCTR